MRPTVPALTLAVCAASLWLLAGCAGDTTAPAPTPTPGPAAAPARVALGPMPKMDANTMVRGRLLYEKECLNCHGPVCKGDGPGGVGLKTDDGQPTKPRDFTDVTTATERNQRISDIAKFVHSGVPCTPMPAFPHLEDAHVWDLARYVNHVIELEADGKK